MTDPESTHSPREALPKWPRRVISAWLIFHLIAVVSAPASVAPSSELARTCWSICRPYLQTLYLNHGYHYFAPNPGESTLLAFTIENADGTTTRDVVPHRRIWPRLLYHRHFMLTESLAMVAGISDRRLIAEEPPKRTSALEAPAQSEVSLISEAPQEGVAVEVGNDFIGQDSAPSTAPLSGLLRDWYGSYARCLLDQSGGERVRLTRVVHYLPEIEWMQESIALGQPLTLEEPQSFAEFPIGTFDRDGLLDDNESLPGSDEAVPHDQPTQRQPELVLTQPAAGVKP